jgi:hypothetical protein
MENNIFDEKPAKVAESKNTKTVVIPEKVTYRMLNVKSEGTIDEDLQPVEVLRCPKVVRVAPYYRFIENGKTIERKFLDKNKPTTLLNKATVDNYDQILIENGVLHLSPASNPDDKDKWEFLKDHPHNRSNPKRNRDDLAMFEEVDTEVKAKNTFKESSKVFDAEKTVREFSIEKARNVYRLLYPVNEKPILHIDEEIIIGALAEYARNNPDEIKELATSPIKYAEQIIKCAEDAEIEIIEYSYQKGAWIWKGDRLEILKVTSDAVRYSEFISYAQTDNGKKSFESIKLKLKELKQI